MTMIDILSPVAATRTVELALAPRLPELKRVRIGWLDNMKANAGDLLGFVAAAWQARGCDFELVRAAKNATVAAPDAVMRRLRTCHAVVLAIAD